MPCSTVGGVLLVPCWEANYVVRDHPSCNMCGAGPKAACVMSSTEAACMMSTTEAACMMSTPPGHGGMFVVPNACEQMMFAIFAGGVKIISATQKTPMKRQLNQMMEGVCACLMCSFADNCWLLLCRYGVRHKPRATSYTTSRQWWAPGTTAVACAATRDAKQ